MHLQIAGDAQHGFFVNIYEGNQLRISRSEEFSIRLFNLDQSTTGSIESWKGETWAGNDSLIILSRSSYIKEFDANLDVSVRYEVIHRHIIKKTIRLFQPSMPDMYYILDETARPSGDPLKYTSFEHDDFPGGFVHEMFPAVGWVTPDHQLVGFLTDAGYKNQYTRTTRRRFSGRGGGFTGMRRLPDPELFSVATEAERNQHDNYIRQTYGEMYNLDAGSAGLIKLREDYQKEGNVEVDKKEGLISLSCHPGGPAGISFISPLKDQRTYTISFLCKGSAPVALKLFRMKNGHRTVELEDGLKYIDAFPCNENEWTLFKGSILVPYIEKDSVSIFIGTQSGKESTLQIKDFSLQENQPRREPYNILPLGKPAEKTTYAFVEPWKSHRDFMISSQAMLAEGKGFRGSLIEKMLYANFNMLTWITSVRDFTPFNVPNMNYMPDMYNRDCFFSTVSTYNKDLNLALWNQWAKTQTPKGAIGTIITPYMGSVEAKDNEASIEWLIWAMLNKRRFGAVLPQDKIKKTVDYVLNEFDSTGNGICYSHFPLCQVDIIDFNPKTDRLAVNQGMLAIALRTIRELGFPVTEDHIAKAEQGYRDFYDRKRKHMLFDKKYPDLISPTDLEPEFFSLWLFGRPILSDEMVINHLDQIPVLNKVAGSPHPEYGTTAPILIHLTKDKKGYAFLSKDYQPFEKFGEENYTDGKNDGYYYNGGSWLRPEYCAYVVGLKHGWKKARDLMENRVWAEINLNPKWPFSKEFIPTKWTSTDSWWPSTRGLCWNVFILMADEVAGLRKPEMDPDYKK
ncbi:MAG: hypothetical protein Q8939_11845 [Bacteroidota bacterium]|nr:hypothetical protein [Bacteroidota bacterium]